MTAPLILAQDGPISAPALTQHLARWAGQDDSRHALAALLTALAEGSIPLAGRLAQGHLTPRQSKLCGG